MRNGRTGSRKSSRNSKGPENESPIIQSRTDSFDEGSNHYNADSRDSDSVDSFFDLEAGRNTESTTQDENNAPTTMSRPAHLYYKNRGLTADYVEKEQERIKKSRVYYTEQSYKYRNYALTLYEILAALRVVLPTLVGEEATPKIIKSVEACVDLPEVEINSAAELKRQTAKLYTVLTEAKVTLEEQLKANGSTMKAGAFVDFASMARHRHYFLKGDDATDSDPFNINAQSDAVNAVKARLEADISFGKVYEPGKTTLLEQRRNPFNPIVTYTEVEGNGRTALLEQRTHFSKESALSDEQVKEYFDLIDETKVSWGGSYNRFISKSGAAVFKGYCAANKDNLPEWFSCLNPDEKRYIIIELLRAKQQGATYLKNFIRASYSFEGSEFRKTPGRKNLFVDGFGIYEKDPEGNWQLAVDSFADIPTRGSVPLLNKLKDDMKPERIRVSAQTLRQNIQQRGESVRQYYAKLFNDTNFKSDEPLLEYYGLINLLTFGDSELGLHACGIQYGNNNGVMTRDYHEAVEHNNNLDLSFELPNGQKVVVLQGMKTYSQNLLRKSAKGPLGFLSSFMLLSEDYEAGGTTSMMSFFDFELKLTIKKGGNDPLLFEFAKNLLPFIQKLKNRTNIKATPLEEINILNDLVESARAEMLASPKSRPESLEFVERYAALVEYLRVITDELEHQPTVPPEQRAASLFQLSLPRSSQESGCKSAKDRKGVQSTIEACLRTHRFLYEEYPQGYDNEKGFVARAKRWFNDVSESAKNFTRIFRSLFLNSHHAAAHSLTAQNFGLKNLRDVLSAEQQAALAPTENEPGITQETLTDIQKIADSTGLKKIKRPKKGVADQLRAAAGSLTKRSFTEGDAAGTDEHYDDDLLSSTHSGGRSRHGGFFQRVSAGSLMGYDSDSDYSDDEGENAFESHLAGSFDELDGTSFKEDTQAAPNAASIAASNAREDASSLDGTPPPSAAPSFNEEETKEPSNLTVITAQPERSLSTESGWTDVELGLDNPAFATTPNENRQALHEALTRVVAQLRYHENNPSPLLSWHNFKWGLALGLVGMLLRHQVAKEAIVFQPMCSAGNLCPPKEWKSPVLMHPENFTVQGDWRYAAIVGLLLSVYTYFALNVFNGRGLVERLVADTACRQPLSREGEKLLSSLTSHQINQIAQHLKEESHKTSFNGGDLLQQSKYWRSPYLAWFANAILTFGAMWFWPSGALAPFILNETTHNEVTVYTNLLGITYAGFVLLSSFREVHHLKNREDEANSMLAHSLIAQEKVSSPADNKVKVQEYTRLGNKPDHGLLAGLRDFFFSEEHRENPFETKTEATDQTIELGHIFGAANG